MTVNQQDPAVPSDQPCGLPARLLAAFIVFPGLVLLSLLATRPPAVVGSDAPATEFSAVRAMAHVRAIAQAPHPVGSAEHTRVRNYLVEQIEKLGLSARVQEDTSARQAGPGAPLRLVRVHNVLTRLPGSGGTGKAVLLVAHYDSVPTGPGASDDGAGVAALLETLRALKASPRLRNDVIFLFSDGEELGLMGASAFQRDDPWAADVGLVLNFEARGTRGPSIMFETGPGAGPLLRWFAAAAPDPVASSYSYDIYRYLPNDTDFTIFKRAGRPGFNFAFIHGFGAYHTRLDTPERADPRSLQHHGSYALSLGRRFGDADLTALPHGGNATYFDLPWVGLVVYPEGWVLPLAALLAVATFLFVILGLKRRRFRPSGITVGVLALPITVVVTTGLVSLLGRGLSLLFGVQLRMLGDGRLLLLGWALFALGLAAAFYLALGRKVGSTALGAGAALWWAAATVASAVYLPSSSFLFAWPLLGALAGLSLVSAGAPRAGSPATRCILLVLAAAPALLLWSPTAALVTTAFGAGSGRFLALMVAFVLSLLAPQVALITGSGSRRWLLPATVFAAGLVLVVVVAATARFSPAHPKPDTLLYGLDTASGQAFWVSFDPRPDRWSSQYLTPQARRQTVPGFLGRGEQKLLATAAPTLPLPPPLVQMVSEEPVDAGRRLVLHVGSARGAGGLLLTLRPASALRAVEIDGREAKLGGADASQTSKKREQGSGDRWSSLYLGLPATGIDVAVELASDTPLEVVAVDRSWGLPDVPGSRFEPRPPSLMPAPFGLTDQTFVRTVATF